MKFLPSLAVLAAVFALQTLHAMSVQPPSFEELVGRSQQVLRTEVLDTRCVVKGEGATRRIVTLVKVRVEKVIVGEAPAELELELLGGQVGNEGLEVSGMTKFQKGDRDILFVAGNGTSICPLVAVNHGRYLLVAEEGTTGEFVARADATPLRSVADIAVDLGDPATRSVQGTACSVTSSIVREVNLTPVNSAESSLPQGAIGVASIAGAMNSASFEQKITECAAALKAAGTVK